MNWLTVRERQSILLSAVRQSATVVFVSEKTYPPGDPPTVPWVRRMMGDEAVASIRLENELIAGKNGAVTNKQALQDIFPEPEIVVQPPFRGNGGGFF